MECCCKCTSRERKTNKEDINLEIFDGLAVPLKNKVFHFSKSMFRHKILYL